MSSCEVEERLQNFTADSIDEVCTQLQEAKLAPRVMVDCSHANSNRDYTKQPSVCRNVMKQIAGGDQRIIGAMIESNLVGGAQKLVAGEPLTYGQSITAVSRSSLYYRGPPRRRHEAR